MPHQQQQHQQHQQHHTNMISPSSLPSELIHGANKNNNNCNSGVDSPSSSSCSSNSTTSSAWQQEEEEQQIFLEDLKDVLTFMKRQESSYEKRATNNRLLRMKNQISHNSNNSNLSKRSLHSNHLPPFYNSWRPVMISWMYHIADTFRLMPIVVATGIYILDTCAVDLELEFDLDLEDTNNSSNSKQKYPLMTMTALNMAVKCHETKMFPLDQLVLLLGGNGGNRYTPDDICTMERYMLEKCEWKLHKPTTHDYILRYVSVLSATPEQRDTILSKSILYLKYSLLWEHILHNQESNDSGSSDGTGTGFSSCVLAYAAFLLAMEEDIDNTAANTDTNNTALLLSFNEKQSACLCLLECGNLSASTPYLQQAYNWLLQSKSLQTQLEQKQQNKNPVAAKQQVQRSSLSQAIPVPVPVPVEAVVVATQTAAAGQASSQVVLSSTKQQQQQQYETTDTTSNMDVDTDKNTPDLLLLSFDNDEKRISASKSTLSDDDTADTSIMTCSDTSATTFSSSSSTYHEIIYCSYSSSSDGDAFEVVAASNISDDNDYEDYDYDYDEYEQEDDDNEDDNDMVVDDEDDHSMSFLPTVLEEEEQEEDHNLEGDNLLKVTTTTSYNNNVHVHVVENNNDEEEQEQEDNNNNNNSLVLTESLHEDGFEIAYGNNKNATSTSGNEQIRLHANSNANNFITSPRDVSIAL